MKTYNKISIFLFLLGSFLILNSKANITGAFIGTTIKPTLSSFLGVMSLILSGAFFYRGSSLEDKFKEPEHLTCDELISKINTIKPDILILDTSAISEYSPKDIEYLLKDRNRVIVPQSVLNEIKDYKMKKVLQERSQKPKNIQKYKRVAQEYLENTDKAQMYKFLMPYVKAKLEGKEMDLTRQEIEKVKEKMKSLTKLAKTDRFDIDGLTERAILEKTKYYLENNCKVTEADVDVVATSIYEAKQGYHPGVIERDKDIKQAIEMLNKTSIIKKKKVGKNIVDYIDIYKN